MHDNTNKTSVELPNININLPIEKKEQEIVQVEQIIECYNEVLSDIREDRKEVDDVLKTFTEMVINGGDATTSSKEALVNLLKLKSEIADKKTKVVELLMKACLKEKDSFPRYLAAHTNTQINIDNGSRKRQMLKGFQEEAKNDDK